ncbi:MAG: single-stranded-DNA-specific exonuclease RecJ [Spirochaetaceae bacterium]|jgi:single-stranded-DNA-specific exonuclease|nr:single-stranded-DNA-specific exonuclease RecJ [Spirochaetaceae bacterium]
MTWDKKDVPQDLVRSIARSYSCDLLRASILARRGITEGRDILFFLEDDLRYQHSPFLFSQMEDAVDRILQAQEEGEKALVFGDRDADGVTGTALLVAELQRMGIDTAWRVPLGDDLYGLSLKAVEACAAEGRTLIITVDCGISNNAEIAAAAEACIDVIVLDHHEEPDEPPSNCIIVNPKAGNDKKTYPFGGISGCAVVYKLLQALRFARSEFYKQEVCLLNVVPLTEAWNIECIKTVNCVKKDSLTETVVPGAVSFGQTRLGNFLRGQQIFVWDAPLQAKQLGKVFGTGVEFNLWDLRNDVASVLPSAAGFSLLRLKEASRIARYEDGEVTEIGCFFNLFVTFVQKKLRSAFPQEAKQEVLDLQLVALAAMADVMPLRDENRIFVRQGLKSLGFLNSRNFNPEHVRPGLLELMSALNLLNQPVTSRTLAWDLAPVINAAGRMGDASQGVELLLCGDPQKRTALAHKLVTLNEERKRLEQKAREGLFAATSASLGDYHGNLCVVVDDPEDPRIPVRGITGLLASSFLRLFRVPAVVITADGGEAVGSVRSPKGVNARDLAERICEAVGSVTYGGHREAAGFSFAGDKIPLVKETLVSLSAAMEPPREEEERVEVDAELPPEYMKPDLLALADAFEPYGADNPELRFLVKKAKITGAELIGRTEKKHLRLQLQFGPYTWPALFWNAADLYGKDFSSGDLVSVVFSVQRNFFKGVESPQMIIAALERAMST